jgi:hypothetical protein
LGGAPIVNGDAPQAAEELCESLHVDGLEPELDATDVSEGTARVASPKQKRTEPPAVSLRVGHPAAPQVVNVGSR